MFNRKLKGKDLAELQKRNNLVNQSILIAQAVEIQKRIWLNEILEKMGFDIKTKQYEVSGKNGEIKEVKQNEPKRT